MEKRANSNSALFIVLSLITIFLVAVTVFVYSFRDSFFKDKLRGIETGENIADAYVKNEKTAFIVLRYHHEFNNLYEAYIIFYDYKGTEYSYITNRVSYEHEIKASEIELTDFSSIRGVYAEYYFQSNIPAPANQTTQAETPELSYLSEIWTWIKSLL